MVRNSTKSPASVKDGHNKSVRQKYANPFGLKRSGTHVTPYQTHEYQKVYYLRFSPQNVDLQRVCLVS
ncbi:hypothetical protein CEXT_362321 [Caerostris extrusa]|uniref:Uncharacterized protein n=1 Tax=Caerostris extrusa TaxID=172846 RepID=A0AAV4QIT8_CAEEX|nr:hypothetical protein CEXT_362321 [Caerostris extrusa]